MTWCYKKLKINQINMCCNHNIKYNTMLTLLNIDTYSSYYDIFGNNNNIINYPKQIARRKIISLLDYAIFNDPDLIKKIMHHIQYTDLMYCEQNQKNVRKHIILYSLIFVKAVKNNLFDSVNILLSYENMILPQIKYNTALKIAIQNDNIEVIKIIIYIFNLGIYWKTNLVKT